MAYELFIFPKDEADAPVTPAMVVDAFTEAGVSCVEQPDESGHWLLLDEHESKLNLTVEAGVVTGAGFRYVRGDDKSVVEIVAEVFKSIGWQVSDANGEL